MDHTTKKKIAKASIEIYNSLCDAFSQNFPEPTKEINYAVWLATLHFSVDCYCSEVKNTDAKELFKRIDDCIYQYSRERSNPCE